MTKHGERTAVLRGGPHDGTLVAFAHAPLTLLWHEEEPYIWADRLDDASGLPFYFWPECERHLYSREDKTDA